MKDGRYRMWDQPSAAIIWEGFRRSCHVSEGRRGNECHLYIGVALHNLLYPCQREWWVSIVGSLLLCSIDLSLPEGMEELVEGLS